MENAGPKRIGSVFGVASPASVLRNDITSKWNVIVHVIESATNPLLLLRSLAARRVIPSRRGITLATQHFHALTNDLGRVAFSTSPP